MLAFSKRNRIVLSVRPHHHRGASSRQFPIAFRRLTIVVVALLFILETILYLLEIVPLHLPHRRLVNVDLVLAETMLGDAARGQPFIVLMTEIPVFESLDSS